MFDSFLCIQQNPELGQFNENTDKFVLHSLASVGLWNISMCQRQESVEREHLSGLHKSTDANKREGINQEAFTMAAIQKGLVILQIVNSLTDLHVIYTIAAFN